MSKILGLFAAALSLALVLGPEASAQPAGAIALAPSASLTLDGLTITVTSCSYDDGGRSGACPSDLYIAPTSGPDASVIIGADSGDILSYTCTSGPTCTSGAYDLSVTLSVTTVSGKSTLKGASVTVAAGSGTTGNLADIGGSETIYDANNSTQLCFLPATAAGPSAACSFAGQNNLQAVKDFGLGINDLPNGNTLQLASITESFTPAPEPASIASLLAGVSALAAVRRKRRRA